MKLSVWRYGMKIIPETVVDEAFIEEVLGLRKEMDAIRFVRTNAMALEAVRFPGTDPCPGVETSKGKQPYRCLVCNGTRRVAHNFYTHPGPGSQDVPCRTCLGTGVVWG